MQQFGFFISELIVRSTCFGHQYAHHQELKSYTDGCCLRYLALWFTVRWSGVALWVLCPVCGMFLEKHPANRSTPEQRPVNLCANYHRQQPSV